MAEHLPDLYPISGLLHVGAGHGAAVEQYRRWKVRCAGFVEADSDRLERLGTAIKGQEGFFTRSAVMAGDEGEAPFFVASNRNESGLVEPETLKPIWRNLETRERQTRQTTTLQALLEGNTELFARQDLNWVVVDCLPALSILRGAGSFVHDWDVVIARVVLDEGMGQLHRDFGRPMLDVFMAEKGFRAANVEAERNPALGHVSYVRDRKSGRQGASNLLDHERTETAVRARSALQAVSGKDVQNMEPSDQTAEGQAQLVVTLQRTSRDLETDRDDLIHRLKKSESLAKSLGAERDAARQLAADRQGIIDELNARLESVQGPGGGRAGERGEQATVAGQKAAATKSDIEARPSRPASTSELEKRIKELTQELDTVREDAKHDRVQLEAELTKAEAQIELIKSLRAERSKV